MMKKHMTKKDWQRFLTDSSKKEDESLKQDLPKETTKTHTSNEYDAYIQELVSNNEHVHIKKIDMTMLSEASKEKLLSLLAVALKFCKSVTIDDDANNELILIYAKHKWTEEVKQTQQEQPASKKSKRDNRSKFQRGTETEEEEERSQEKLPSISTIFKEGFPQRPPKFSATNSLPQFYQPSTQSSGTFFYKESLPFANLSQPSISLPQDNFTPPLPKTFLTGHARYSTPSFRGPSQPAYWEQPQKSVTTTSSADYFQSRYPYPWKIAPLSQPQTTPIQPLTVLEPQQISFSSPVSTPLPPLLSSLTSTSPLNNYLQKDADSVRDFQPSYAIQVSSPPMQPQSPSLLVVDNSVNLNIFRPGKRKRDEVTHEGQNYGGEKKTNFDEVTTTKNVITITIKEGERKKNPHLVLGPNLYKKYYLKIDETHLPITTIELNNYSGNWNRFLKEVLETHKTITTINLRYGEKGHMMTIQKILNSSFKERNIVLNDCRIMQEQLPSRNCWNETTKPVSTATEGFFGKIPNPAFERKKSRKITTEDENPQYDRKYSPQLT